MGELERLIRSQQQAALQQQQQQAVQIAAPVNDIQLIALVAAQSSLEPAEAVEWAADIVAEAMVNGMARFQETAQRLKYQREKGG